MPTACDVCCLTQSHSHTDSPDAHRSTPPPSLAASHRHQNITQKVLAGRLQSPNKVMDRVTCLRLISILLLAHWPIASHSCVVSLDCRTFQVCRSGVCVEPSLDNAGISMTTLVLLVAVLPISIGFICILFCVYLSRRRHAALMRQVTAGRVCQPQAGFHSFPQSIHVQGYTGNAHANRAYHEDQEQPPKYEEASSGPPPAFSKVH